MLSACLCFAWVRPAAGTGPDTAPPQHRDTLRTFRGFEDISGLVMTCLRPIFQSLSSFKSFISVLASHNVWSNSRNHNVDHVKSFSYFLCDLWNRILKQTPPHFFSLWVCIWTYSTWTCGLAVTGNAETLLRDPLIRTSVLQQDNALHHNFQKTTIRYQVITR